MTAPNVFDSDVLYRRMNIREGEVGAPVWAGNDGHGGHSNNTPLQFTFTFGDTMYVNAMASYISFTLATSGATPSGLAQLRLGPHSLFSSIELIGANGYCYERCLNPELTHLIRLSTKGDPMKGVGMTQRPASVPTGTLFRNSFNRKYVIQLSDLLGIFNSDVLLTPHLLQGARLVLYPAASLSRAVQGSTVVLSAIPRANAPNPGSITYSELLGGVTSVSIENARLHCDMVQLEPQRHAQVTDAWLRGALEVYFDAMGVTRYDASNAASGVVHEYQLSRAYGAVNSVYTKVSYDVAGADNDASNYNSLVRRNSVDETGTAFNIATPYTDECGWGLSSFQLRHGNVLHPEVPINTPEEGLLHYAHSIDAIGPGEAKLPPNFAEFFPLYDLVGMRLGTNNRVRSTEMNPQSASGLSRRVNFDQAVTLRVELNRGVSNQLLQTDDATLTPGSVPAPALFLYVLVNHRATLTHSPAGGATLE